MADEFVVAESVGVAGSGGEVAKAARSSNGTASRPPMKVRRNMASSRSGLVSAGSPSRTEWLRGGTKPSRSRGTPNIPVSTRRASRLGHVV